MKYREIFTNRDLKKDHYIEVQGDFLQSSAILLRRSILMKYREIFIILRDLIKKEHYDEVHGDFYNLKRSY